MKRSLLAFLLILISMLCVPPYSDATFVRYDLISGSDNLGNPFSGFMFVNDTPIITPYYDNQEWFSIQYEIGGFKFVSEGGRNIGHEGFLSLPPGNPDYYVGWGIAVAHFVGDYYWSNSGNPIWFGDDMDDVINYEIGAQSYYLSLHEYIRIISLGCMETPEQRGPLGDGPFIWQRHDQEPVPEPATILLLASGLVGLVGMRKRFRK
jgi:hypothetical protein